MQTTRRLSALGLAAGSCLGTPLFGQVTERVSLASGGAQASGPSSSCAISRDGRYVAFTSSAVDLVAGDTNAQNDTFLHDRALRTTERVSVSGAGVQGNSFSSEKPSVSGSGRFVAFASSATNLVLNDTNAKVDVFVRDRELDTTTRVSVSSAGVQGNDRSERPAISEDGRFVAFESRATNLVAGDVNAGADVFVFDRQTSQIECISVDLAGVPARGDFPALSADGRYVCFRGRDAVLGQPTVGGDDIFLRDRQTGTTERISVDGAGVQGSAFSNYPTVTPDGRFVAFLSQASNLVPGDTNSIQDIFVRDRQLGTTERVSVDSAGTQGGLDCYFAPAISDDGRFVAYTSDKLNLVAGDTNGTADIFLRDRQLALTTRLSVDSAGAQTNGHSNYPAMSADGRFIAFDSGSTDLVSGDTNAVWDVFVRDRTDAAPGFAFCTNGSLGSDHSTTCPCANAGTDPQAGCAHSFSAAGAALIATGSRAADTLPNQPAQVVLIASNAPSTAFTLFMQHSAAGEQVFHDGVVCVDTGTLLRLRGRNAGAGQGQPAGQAVFPNNLFANDSTLTLSQRGGVLPGSGLTRFYAGFYRNASTTFCPPATANVTNGYAITW